METTLKRGESYHPVGGKHVQGETVPKMKNKQSDRLERQPFLKPNQQKQQ
jgi:hypothetical protein